MNTRIILASASPRRRELLKQVGLWPEIMPSRADETIGQLPPEEMVKALSYRKAREVAVRLFPQKSKEAAEELLSQKSEEAAEELLSQKSKGTAADAVVIGADTVVAVDGEILGKPKSHADAVRMLELIQGRTHHVYTGVTLYFAAAEETVTFVEQTEVEVYPMTVEQIERYIATGEPMDKAGAYGIQGSFAAYVKGIRGDYNNVVGLPTARVCQELAARGLF